MRSLWSSDRALWARGRGSEERRSTPSILNHISTSVSSRICNATYSNAKAKSGCFAPGLDVIKDRDHCAEHAGLHHCDSTEGLASLLSVVVAVVGILLYDNKVKESYRAIHRYLHEFVYVMQGPFEHFCATAIPTFI